MTDRIRLAGMRFLGHHGVTLEERIEPQPIEVDVILEVDLSGPAASDELADTLDYGALFELVEGIVTGRSFRLLEALAGEIASEVLASAAADGPAIERIEVRVRKPGAPLPGTFETVEVTVRRPGRDRAPGE